MSHDDYKLLVINGATFIMSFTQIEQAFKIILLGFSIMYTLYKIIDLYDERKSRKKQ